MRFFPNMNLTLKLTVIATISISLAGCVETLKNVKGHQFSLETYTKSGKSPTVLISHGSACLTEHERRTASLVNSWGYNAVVIDHCAARGVSRYTGENPPVSLLPSHKALDYFEAAAWVKKQPWHQGKIAVMGFSRGGAAALAATDMENLIKFSNLQPDAKNLLAGVIAYYPACNPTQRPRNPQIPALIHHGKEDNLSHVSLCGYKREEISPNPNYQVILYAGAHHGFDQDFPEMKVKGFIVSLRYDRKAALASQETSRKFLKDVLSP
jgi:dienelactone hydrolase